MKLGVFTPLLSKLPLAEVLTKLKTYGIRTVELGTGNYPGNSHCDLGMLDDASALDKFKALLAEHEFSISALSCHGNPLHPDPAQAKAAAETNRKTILLAEKLGVKTVVDFSGCPGDHEGAKNPNWVTCPVASRIPRRPCLAVGQSRHPPIGSNAPSSLPITASASPSRCTPASSPTAPKPSSACATSPAHLSAATTTPSHMFWQSIDPVAAIRVLGDAIFHVHAKDTQLYSANLMRTGVLDTKPYTDERNRGWIFRTCGYRSRRGVVERVRFHFKDVWI